MWRVGNGQSINIWEDPWLPRDLSRLPISPRGRTLITKVEELIDPVTEKWDIPLLEQIFGEEDVQLVRSIPLNTEMDAALGWHFDAKGCFSVKLAYKVHKAYETRQQNKSVVAGTGGSNGGPELWKRMWNLECPLKVKHFLWRMCHNTLALKRILKRRGVKTDTLCTMCSRLDEDGGASIFQM